MGRSENEGPQKSRVRYKEEQRPGERTRVWGTGDSSHGAHCQWGVRAGTGCTPQQTSQVCQTPDTVGLGGFLRKTTEDARLGF